MSSASRRQYSANAKSLLFRRSCVLDALPENVESNIVILERMAYNVLRLHLGRRHLGCLPRLRAVNGIAAPDGEETHGPEGEAQDAEPVSGRAADIHHDFQTRPRFFTERRRRPADTSG